MTHRHKWGPWRSYGHAWLETRTCKRKRPPNLESKRGFIERGDPDKKRYYCLSDSYGWCMVEQHRKSPMGT